MEDFADKIIEDEMAALKDSEKPKNRYIFLDELLAATQDRTTIRSELLNSKFTFRSFKFRAHCA